MNGEDTAPKGFEKLWAPWRMKYIEEIDTGGEDACIFCDAPREGEDRKRYIVYRGNTCYCIMNIFPYNNGHLLVVPFHHTGELDTLSAETRLELFDTADMVVHVMKNTMRPDGFNIGMNLGRSAGAGIASHLHLHIVPRWNGDTNFMPVIGGTKVISESLDDTYEKLTRAIGEYLSPGEGGEFSPDDVRSRLKREND